MIDFTFECPSKKVNENVDYALLYKRWTKDENFGKILRFLKRMNIKFDSNNNCDEYSYYEPQ